MSSQSKANDATSGRFTTGKLQALLDARTHPEIGNRRDLAEALAGFGARISKHGVEAWFRRVDSNYNQPRESLHRSSPSFAIPNRHWPLLLDLFSLSPEDIDRSDDDFARSALSGNFSKARKRKNQSESNADDAPSASTPPELSPLNKNVAKHLVGREREVAALVSELEKSQTDGARMVFLEGAPGLGKTSLVEELVRRARTSNRGCITASCTENDYVPLLPLLDLVRLQRDEVARGGPEALRIAQELLTRIELANESSGLRPQVSGNPSSLTAFDARSALFLLGSDLLVVLSAQVPLLVVVDDVHWLDPTTRDLLLHFARFLRLNRHYQVLLVLAGREFSREFIHQMPTGDFTCRITLQPLDKRSTGRAAERQLRQGLNPPALDYVWGITRGNPLYIEQLCEHLMISGQLELHNSKLALTAPVDAIQVPETLDDFYRRRFDSLEPQPAECLQLAACVGQQVDADFLLLLMPEVESTAVLRALDEGENEGLLRFSNRRYEFCHPVARHAVYMAMTDTKRSQQHALVAAAITRSLPDPTPHALIELAYHLVRGRPFTDAADTLRACRRAAGHSHQLAAWSGTEYFANNALLLDEELSQLSEDERGVLLRLRGSSRHLTARPVVALQDLTKALERFQLAQNTEEYTRTLSQVVRIRSNFSEVREGADEAAEELGEYVELLGGANNETAASALEVLASFRLANNDSREAQRLAELVIAGRSGPDAGVHKQQLDAASPESAAFSSITAGIACLNHLDVQNALGYLLDATRWSRENQDQPTLVRSLQRLILAQLVMGRVDDVAATYAELRNLGGATITGEHSTVCAAMSAALAVRGSYEEAQALAADGLELVDLTGYGFMETALVGNQVYSLLRLGCFDEASQAIKRLEVARPRRAAALLRSAIDSAREPTKPEALSQPTRLSALSERALDIGELARLCMLTEQAIATQDTEVLTGVVAKLHNAERMGVVFSVAWPVQLPLLIGRAHLALGKALQEDPGHDLSQGKHERDAHYYLRKSLDYGRAQELGAQLKLAERVLYSEWPTERELGSYARSALDALS